MALTYDFSRPTTDGQQCQSTIDTRLSHQETNQRSAWLQWEPTPRLRRTRSANTSGTHYGRSDYWRPGLHSGLPWALSHIPCWNATIKSLGLDVDLDSGLRFGFGLGTLDLDSGHGLGLWNGLWTWTWTLHWTLDLDSGLGLGLWQGHS